jgi:GNAT superfamily N-acetyltransferase
VTSVAGDPRLLAGWEPTAPAGDTLLRAFLQNWTESLAAPVLAMGGRGLRDEFVAAFEMGRPAGFFNAVILQQPLAVERVDEVAARLAAHYRDGTGEVWLFSAWPSPDLRPFGWELSGHPPLMLRPASPALEPPGTPPGLVITEVDDARGLRALEEVAVAGYPLLELADAPPGALVDERALADGRLRAWVGRSDDRPVAASMAFVDTGLVDVTLVATLPGFRGRGFGEALTWVATLADPSLPAMLVASDPGRPVYERMGYLPLLRLTAWLRDRPVAT